MVSAMMNACIYPWYAWHKAMVTVHVQLPEEAFSALRRSPDEMAGDLRLAAAVHWYSRGLMSQERAAQVAGLDRTDFILALAREGVDAFAVDMTSLRRELADG
jgi:predicted HTH domain antitoxin